jgi:hypothetical protein
MASNPVLAPETLEATLVRDVIRDGLRAQAAGSGPLEDPMAVARVAAGGAPFVMTSFPDRNPFYPLIIVAEQSGTSEPPDARFDFWEDTYAVAFRILAESTTHVKNIKDQVKNWIKANKRVLQDAGYSDVKIISDTPATWDPTNNVKEWRIVISGRVYTSPTVNP